MFGHKTGTFELRTTAERANMVLGFRRRQDTWQRLHGKPARERHFTSMVFSIAAIISLAVAVGLPWWAIGNSSNGDCYFEFGLVSVKVQNLATARTYSLSVFYSVLQQVIVACILCLVACTLVLQCIAGVISAGYPRERFEFLRHFSVFNIVSLICVVTSGGFWLWVCELFPRRNTDYDDSSIYAQDLNTFCGSQVSFPEVTFHAGFYVCILSGIFCLIALSINMICSRSAVDRRRRERQRLRHRERNFDAFLSRNVTEMQDRARPASSNPEPLPPPTSPPPPPPPPPPELSDTEGYATSEGEITDAENPPPYAP